jgi:hypothetical protein
VYTPSTDSVLLKVANAVSLSMVPDDQAVAPAGMTAETTSWVRPSSALFQVTVSFLMMVIVAALNWFTPVAPPPFVWPTTTVVVAAFAVLDKSLPSATTASIASTASGTTTRIILDRVEVFMAAVPFLPAPRRYLFHAFRPAAPGRPRTGTFGVT